VGIDAWVKYQNGLLALHRQEREGATPIPAEQQGVTSAAFEIAVQSGKEVDMRRAILEELNQFELNHLCV
jgi:hypothetical protein